MPYNSDQAALVSIVYAKSKSAGREELWEYMRTFATTVSIPWTVCGDFNSIINAEEKMGGVPHRLGKSLPFIECLNDCGLMDMGYSGHTFTWCNERKGKEIIWKRLDRMVANNEWDIHFSKISVQHLTRLNSDHCPILITAEKDDGNYIKYFKFLNFLVDRDNFRDIVKQK
ncbi:uncharacterized protein LOC142180006 [Nicotiana tabacum]|uniref:Uncharacterized protein LOC142180006 n=1 Tax=Nicotiana tabacum TaxID=4097 RepID=A0AC58UC04_TOBAC